MDVESSLKQLGNEALHDLYQNLTGAKQFVLEQAPDVCRQIIAWQMAQGVICACIFLLLAVVAAWQWRGFYAALRDPLRYRNDEELPHLAMGSVASVFAVGALIALVVEGSEAIKALVAPKLFLIEYIARLIK